LERSNDIAFAVELHLQIVDIAEVRREFHKNYVYHAAQAHTLQKM
jgi:hypothetical protein